MPEQSGIGADTPHGSMISASGGAARTAASWNEAAASSSAGTALGPVSVVAPNVPLSRSCCRQAWNCPLPMPCLRATAAADAPGTRLSATIWRFCSAVQLRRRLPQATSLASLRALV
jgi:hypothetical protein